MRAVRLLAIAVLTAAALLLAAMGLMLLAGALGDNPPEVEAGPLLVAAIGGLFIAVASLVGWLAWLTRRMGKRDGPA